MFVFIYVAHQQLFTSLSLLWIFQQGPTREQAATMVRKGEIL